MEKPDGPCGTSERREEKRAEDGIYFVLRVGSSISNPKVHLNSEDAREEAERLVRKENVDFEVMQVVSIGVCRLSETPVVWDSPRRRL